MKNLFFILSFFIISSTVLSQKHSTFLGIEGRVYPAGSILTVRGTFDVKEGLSFIGALGINLTNRQDFGVHYHEEGKGWGGLVGLRYRPFKKIKQIYVGIESFMWQLSIDWRDKNPLINGETKITVFQPAVNGGYSFINPTKRFFLEVGVAFGREINIATDRKEVGQGGISMLLLAMGIKI